MLKPVDGAAAMGRTLEVAAAALEQRTGSQAGAASRCK